MSKRMILSLLLVLLIGAGALVVIAATPSETRESCCFTHPDYAGTCEASAGEGETCQAILQYLNTPMSQGKTYCGGTELRGGWALSSCAEP